MKKIVAIILAATVAVTFFACSKEKEQEIEKSETNTFLTTTTEPATSTTAPVKEDSEKASELKKAVLNGIDESSNGSITGDLSKGSFTHGWARADNY